MKKKSAPELQFTPEEKLWGKYIAKRHELAIDLREAIEKADEFEAYLNSSMKLFKIIKMEKGKNKLKLPGKRMQLSNFVCPMVKDSDVNALVMKFTLIMIFVPQFRNNEKIITKKISILTNKILDLRDFIKMNPKRKATIIKEYKKLDILIVEQKKEHKNYKKYFKDVQQLIGEIIIEYKRIKDKLK